MRKYLLAIIFNLCFLTIIAQPNYAVPSGVYCSCGPTMLTGTGSVAPDVAAKPFVKGILVRIGWNLIEPSNNTYNWAPLDTQIVRARSYGKKVALSIVNGPSAPQWLYNLGVQKAIIGAPFNDTIPIAWDNTYLEQWDELITQLGNRYDGDTTITLIHMTNATANGFEFFLNPLNMFDWNSVGYTDNNIINSWKSVVNSYNNAFPNHYLDNDFHPIFLTGNSSSIPSDSIYQYAMQTLGARYGAFSSWWTQNNAANYTAQYADLQQSANTTFATVQMAYNATNDSSSFGAGGLHGAIQLAIDNHICYWEVWNQDILNPNLDSLLSNSTCTTTELQENNIKENTLILYPNPVSESDNITFGLTKESIVSYQLYDIMGKKITGDNVYKNTIRVNIPQGMYNIVFTTNTGSVYCKKIMVKTAN